MLPVKRELTNEHDRFAVAVLKDGDVVGHVPRSLSKTNSFFLRHDGNVVFCEVTGERLNQEWRCLASTGFTVARNTWINSRSWWLQSRVLTIHYSVYYKNYMQLYTYGRCYVAVLRITQVAGI